MRNKKTNSEMIPMSRAAHAMRISEDGIFKLISRGQLKVIVDNQGKEIVSIENFKRVAYSDEVKELVEEGLRAYNLRYLEDVSTGRNEKFLQRIETKTDEYKKYVEEIEKLHSKYDSRIRVLKEETPVVAAYILFARAISLLKMACLCLENKFIETTILLRPIDESIQLAEYFILAKEDPVCKKNLIDWFRINRIPRNETCRKEIVKDIASSFPFLKENFEYNIDILHHLKSKMLHHSFNSIMESHRQKVTVDGLASEGFDYGIPRDMRKVLELTDFFKSSIWSTVQAFLRCFLTEIPMDQEDIIRLKQIDDKFNKETR